MRGLGRDPGVFGRLGGCLDGCFAGGPGLLGGDNCGRFKLADTAFKPGHQFLQVVDNVDNINQGNDAH